MTRYPLQQLRDVLMLDGESVQVEPTGTYPIAGLYSFGRGVFAREPISGTETGYGSLTRLRSGQFVVSKLKAFEGAVAVVPRDFNGWYVSPEFPTFGISDRADAEYLTYLCHWPRFWGLLQQASTGVGARRERVHPDKLLSIPIPLPSVDEQRRVAQRLDRVLTRIARLLGLVDGTLVKLRALETSSLSATFRELHDREPLVPLAEVVELNAEVADPATEAGATFRYVDIGAIDNRTTQIKWPKEIAVADAPSRARRRIREGDLVLSTVRPNLRGVARVPPDLDGAIASTGLAVLRPRPGVDRDFLLLQIASDAVVDQLTGEARGGHYPAVSDRRLRNVLVAMPSRAVQRDLAEKLGSIMKLVRDAVVLRRMVLTRLRALEASVLNAAFEGEL